MFARERQTRRGLSVLMGCALTIVAAVPSLAGAQAPQVEIDLDRNTAGVQSQILGFVGGTVLQGAVVVTGAAADTAADHAVEVNLARSGGGDAVNCANTTFSDGEITSSFGNQLCAATFLRRSKLFVNPAVAVGDDGILVLFNFNAEILGSDGESVIFDFTATSSNPQLGITINGSPRTFGAGTQNPIATANATVRIGGDITPVPVACEDAGYYVLDALGGRHHVGAPLSILGSLYYGRDVAEDMEKDFSANRLKGPILEPDLVVLDTFGAVQNVSIPADSPGQTFYFPEGSSPECGYAIDVEVASDFEGYWVLTERGGIFRAGSALPDGQPAQLGGDAADLCTVLGIPFGGDVPRDPSLPTTDGALIRAVGFVVVESGNAEAPTGFIVLDSQGGHYTFDASGNALSDGVADSILNGDTVYPFFKGLDIARDIELPVLVPAAKAFASSDPTTGLVIYDGWGGVHPVPVTDTANSLVSFLRNDGLTTVGLPYLKVGFDDPATAGVDEGNASEVGIDVGSIFKDIEFCASGSEGVYVLEGFGGVFAFGSTRAAADSPATMFTGSPYFFPNIYARDLEATFYAEMGTVTK